jgi:hypothetical protein
MAFLNNANLDDGITSRATVLTIVDKQSSIAAIQAVKNVEI